MSRSIDADLDRLTAGVLESCAFYLMKAAPLYEQQGKSITEAFADAAKYFRTLAKKQTAPVLP